MPTGMLALLSGDPGSGKTFLSLAIAAALSRGRTPYTQEECEPVNTVYLSQENSPEHVVRPRFDSLKGDCGRFYLLQRAIDLADTDTLDAAIFEAEAGLLIVDPIQSYLGADVDLHRSNETRPILDGLGQLALERNCCILLVRHLSKSSGGRAIHRGLGSVDITGAARTELLAGTAPDDPNRRAMVQMKSNLGLYGQALDYTIGEDGFAWAGKSDLTASDLLSPGYGIKRQTEVDGAAEYLQSQLAEGSKPQTELVEQSIYPERTLQRAAQKTGHKKKPNGYGWPMDLEPPVSMPDNETRIRQQRATSPTQKLSGNHPKHQERYVAIMDSIIEQDAAKEDDSQPSDSMFKLFDDCLGRYQRIERERETRPDLDNRRN